MKWSTKLTRTAAAMLVCGLAGLMGACESSGSTGSGASRDVPLGVGSGSPTFLHRPSQQAAQPAPAPADPEPRRPAPARSACDYTPRVGPGMSVVGLPFPTGDRATSALMLHQVMPAEVRRGAEFEYTYHVTNTTQGTLQNVAVILESQSNLEVISATPSAMTGQAGTVWALGDLGPCETRVINVKAKANNTGQAANCVSVSYNNSLCAVTNVVDPDLAIEKRVTPRVIRCDPITIVYNVCNPGTGVATGVVVRDTLPNGLTVNGSRNVEIAVGDLASGECREVSVIAMASTTGEFASAATARSADGLSASSGDPSTTVVAPKLILVCEGRDNQYLDRNTEYTFKVSNSGDGVAANTVINVAIPAGAEFVRASSGGVPGAGNVSFNVGDLNPGQERSITVSFLQRMKGTMRAAATATAACAEPVSTACETNYLGIPAILLEVVDLVDPVEVGQTTTYRITVTNQGSASDSNIVIKCVLPDEMEFVGSTGPTAHSVNGKEITYAPLASLAPGAEVSWNLTARALSEANIRFSVEMTSDNFVKPVRETEATYLYD